MLESERDNCVMNVWNEQLLPRFTDRALQTASIARFRRRVCQGLHGEVVEIGFGSGLNVPCYPDSVQRVLAIEPSMVARDLSAKRVAGSPVEVDFRGLDGQSLPVVSESVDCALSTFTLCTIPNAQQALSELWRVLKPGGSFHFLEHGVAPSRRVAAWQHRLNGLQHVVAGGCNLNRPIDKLVQDAGFEGDWLKTAQLPGPRLSQPWGYLYFGVARK